MEALNELFDRIRLLLAEHEQLDKSIRENVPNNDSDSDPDELPESRELRKDLLAKSRDIQILTKTVPEGKTLPIA